jgi:hypothetical protein
MKYRRSNAACSRLSACVILAVDAGAVRHGGDRGEDQRGQCAVGGEEQAQSRENKRPFMGTSLFGGGRPCWQHLYFISCQQLLLSLLVVIFSPIDA